jgi:polyhydroxyalkanoate synthesis regulator phasin
MGAEDPLGHGCAVEKRSRAPARPGPLARRCMRGYSSGLNLAVQHREAVGFSKRMNQVGQNDENWAQAWIDEQREKMRTAAAEEGNRAEGDTSAHDFSSFWKNLNSDVWSGIEKVLRAAIPDTAPLGWAREYEQEWRDLLAAQADYQKLQGELLAIFTRVQSEALDRLEHIVRERKRADRPFEQARELYDTWVDCAEQTYATVAHSEEYCRLQAALANAGVRVRAQQQKLIERALKQFDLPTRAEINSMHRELRTLRERLDRIEQKRATPSKSRAARTRAHSKKRSRA